MTMNPKYPWAFQGIDRLKNVCATGSKEVFIELCAGQLAKQKLHALYRAERIQHLSDDPYPVKQILFDQDLFFPFRSLERIRVKAA